MLRKYLGTLFSLLLFVVIATACQAQVEPPSLSLTTNYTINGGGTPPDEYKVSVTCATSQTTVVSSTYLSLYTIPLGGSGYFYSGIYGFTGTNLTLGASSWEVLPEYTYTVTVTPQDGQTVSSSYDVTLNVTFYQWEVASAGGYMGVSGESVSAATNDDDGGGDPSLIGVNTTTISPASVQVETASYRPAPPDWYGSDTVDYPSSSSWQDISNANSQETVSCSAGTSEWTGTYSFYIPPASGTGGADIPISADVVGYTPNEQTGGGTSYSENVVAAVPVSIHSNTFP